MPPEKITSLQNPRVKQLVKLRDRRPRDEAGVFLVEGFREIRRALEKRVALTELYFSPEWFLGENEPALLAQAEAAGAQLFELTKEAFAKVAYRERPDGLLAVAPQWKKTLADLEAVVGRGLSPTPVADRADVGHKARPTAPFLLVVEAIEKPGNLGTILRSAPQRRISGASRTASWRRSASRCKWRQRPRRPPRRATARWPPPSDLPPRPSRRPRHRRPAPVRWDQPMPSRARQWRKILENRCQPPNRR